MVELAVGLGLFVQEYFAVDNTISMLEFCRNIDAAIARVENGESLTLLRDGKPAVQLAPAANGKNPSSDDPFFRSKELAEKWIPREGDESLSNDDIDRIVYGL